MIPLRPRTRRRLGLLAVPVVAAALVLAALAAVGQTAAAQAATLTQVTDFGSSPGNLQTYSYVPSGLPSSAPLVVALHGCTQSATDYYDNSGWPKYADLWGFAVVFPQQVSSNNSLDCFKNNYHVDPSRIYITGLSAGGGMADDMLADYPADTEVSPRTCGALARRPQAPRT